MALGRRDARPLAQAGLVALVSAWRILRGLAAVAALGGIFATSLALATPWWWVGELAVPWLPHVGVALVAASLVLVRETPGALVLGLVGLAVALSAAPRLVQRGVAGARGAELLLLNVQQDSVAHEAVIALLHDAGADIVVLVEVDARWASALRSLEGWPHRALAPRDDRFGLAVLSRWPVRTLSEPEPGRGPGRFLPVEVATPDGPLRVVAVHAFPPISAWGVEARSADLATVARRAAALPAPVVVAGDLNAVPWAGALAPLTDAGLVDGGRGYGLSATWPAFLGPLGIPIDHVMVSPEVGVTRWEVGRDVGSDHLPVRVRLAW